MSSNNIPDRFEGLTPRIQERIRKELGDERILYFSRQIPWLAVRRDLVSKLINMVIFGFFSLLLIGTIGQMIQDTALDPEAALIDVVFFPAFLSLFLIACLYGATAPLRSWLRAYNTCFIITDARAVEYRTGLLSRVKSYKPSDIKFVELLPRPDGSGTVYFSKRKVHRTGKNGHINYNSHYYEKEGFVGVKAAHIAANHIEKLRS